jgi:hypothetical protein
MKNVSIKINLNYYGSGFWSRENWKGNPKQLKDSVRGKLISFAIFEELRTMYLAQFPHDVTCLQFTKDDVVEIYVNKIGLDCLCQWTVGFSIHFNKRFEKKNPDFFGDLLQEYRDYRLLFSSFQYGGFKTLLSVEVLPYWRWTKDRMWKFQSQQKKMLANV